MTILACIPGNCWENQPETEIKHMVEETKRFEKLIIKTANQQNNYRRMVMSRQAAWDLTTEKLNICESQAEFERIIERDLFPALRISKANCVKDLPFAIPPLETGSWQGILQGYLDNNQKWFLEMILSTKSGIVLIPSITIMNREHPSLSADIQISASRIASQEISLKVGEAIETHVITEEVIENEFILFQKEIEKSISDQTTINVSNYHHQVLTAGLHKTIFRGETTGTLGVTYEDNSRGLDFSFKPRTISSDKVTEAESMTPLRCALMSMRHMELDTVVDIAWFNNRETSLRGVCAAEIDRLCYERSLRLFAYLPLDQLTCIWMYQTGFQPSVIGFYRAVAEVLEKGQPRIAIKPMIFQGDENYKQYEWWI